MEQNDNLRRQIVAEALTYVGTPFKQKGRLKGIGVDCVGVAVGIAAHLGLTHMDIHSYPNRPNGQLHSILASQLVEVTQLQPADILMISFSGEPWHVAIYIGDDWIVHAYASVRKCVMQRYSDGWKERTAGIFRFREVATWDKLLA